jgi:hypothetical protein
VRVVQQDIIFWAFVTAAKTSFCGTSVQVVVRALRPLTQYLISPVPLLELWSPRKIKLSTCGSWIAALCFAFAAIMVCTSPDLTGKLFFCISSSRTHKVVSA